MSRRFGRNQRRQLREQIAKLEEKASRALSDLSDMTEQRNKLTAELDRWAKDIRHLLGADSAFNREPSEITVEDYLLDEGAMYVDPAVGVPILPRLGVRHMLTARETIEAAICSFELRQDDYAQMLRIMLVTKKGRVGYAINDTRLHRMSPRDIDVLSETIAHEIAEFMKSEDWIEPAGRRW